MIEGVLVTPLKIISHAKGDIFHGMRRSEDAFLGFGEAYFSSIKSGEVKGWKKHSEMTLNLIVPIGRIQFVMFDHRDESSTKGQCSSITLGPDNYQRLTVPAGIWVAFKGCDQNLSYLLNIANIEHSPDESENKRLDEIEFDWDA